jgi:protein-S-isoprenylcysteine O-methyltransferase Ste14
VPWRSGVPESIRAPAPRFVAGRSPWVLVPALPRVIILRYRVVAREEAYLERRFGDAYRDYKARVRRWL